MLKIAFISNYFGIGGMERTFLSIAENLKEKNYSFHFINLAENHFQGRFHACGQCFHSTDFSAIIKYLKQNAIDIVQTCNCDDGSYLAYMAGIKTIIERPDGLSSAFLSDKTPVSTIICSTNKVFDKAKKLYPNKHIEMIYNGVDTNIFFNKQKNKTLLKQLNVTHKDIIIGYSGRIAESKCLSQLIDIFAKISAKFPNCKLLFLGDEFPHNCGYKNMLKNKIKALRIVDKIKFKEATEHPEKIIGLFDVSVLCSGSFKLPDGTYEVEGIPNSIMESMAMGIPAVATDSGETNLLIKNNENGFIVGVTEWNKFKEKLELLIEKNDLRKKMGLSAQNHIKINFSLKTMINKYHKIYKFASNNNFQSKYPKALTEIRHHFLSNEFNLLNEDVRNKKIVIIKSGSDALFYRLMKNIKDHFKQPDITILINKDNYKNIRIAFSGVNFLIYDKTKHFSLNLMDDTINKLNREKFDYLFFLFNDLQGKNYKNIGNIASVITASKKIVFNKLFKLFRWD